MPERNALYFRLPQTRKVKHMGIIAFQPELRPALIQVSGCKDYQEYRAILIEMDRILAVSGLEQRLINTRMKAMGVALFGGKAQRHAITIRTALRYAILLGVTQLSYRKLARTVADSILYQWFTYTNYVDGADPYSKSTIERFEKMFSHEEIEGLIHEVNQVVADRAGAEKLLYREAALRFNEVFADSTCVKSNIHFPVDWVLLRDATRTLMKAVTLIRDQGLLHRMEPPEAFICRMNKLCIEMTHTRKKRDGRKARKKIFRRMKTLMRAIKLHAERYYELLSESWEQTDWSEAEARNIRGRIMGVLLLLPHAVWQAHERIIGERRVANKDKLLSFYQPDARILVRGKADAEVEYGQGLYLAEQADGLIVDWNFMEGHPTADSQLVEASLERMIKHYDSIESYTGDRGFDGPKSRAALDEASITNAICPRSVPALKEKLQDEEFRRLQKRRGNTEARIAILKNNGLDNPLRSKGYNHRQIRIELCILTHNLWKLATMAAQKRKELEVAKKAA
jgi:hypothetical protein